MGVSSGKKKKLKNNKEFIKPKEVEDIDSINNNNTNSTQSTVNFQNFDNKNIITTEKFICKNNNNLNISIDNNFIIAEIYIKDEDVIKDIRIINSYEECLRNIFPKKEIKVNFMNEKEIKECIIKINDKEIPFNYFLKFDKKGFYNIKYYFKKYLTKANCLFYGCENIKSINLSNFETKNVINMNSIFFGCFSLTKINLTNFNT